MSRIETAYAETLGLGDVYAHGEHGERITVAAARDTCDKHVRIYTAGGEYRETLSWYARVHVVSRAPFCPCGGRYEQCERECPWPVELERLTAGVSPIIAYLVGSFWLCPEHGKDYPGAQPQPEGQTLPCYEYRCDHPGCGKLIAAKQDGAEPPASRIDTSTLEGAAIADLWHGIKALEQADGSWPGADVVDEVSTFFSNLGLDPDGPADQLPDPDPGATP